jgi:hypothetical protein
MYIIVGAILLACICWRIASAHVEWRERQREKRAQDQQRASLETRRAISALGSGGVADE